MPIVLNSTIIGSPSDHPAESVQHSQADPTDLIHKQGVLSRKSFQEKR